MDKLDNQAAQNAIRKPERDLGVNFNDDAVQEILEITQGYPCFSQEWGKHVWNAASQTSITLEDVHRASALTMASMGENFFKVRLDRTTPAQKVLPAGNGRAAGKAVSVGRHRRITRQKSQRSRTARARRSQTADR